MCFLYSLIVDHGVRQESSQNTLKPRSVTRPNSKGGTHEVPVKYVGEDVAVDHPLITVEKGLQSSSSVGSCLELCASCFDLEGEKVVLTATVFLATELHMKFLMTH